MLSISFALSDEGNTVLSGTEELTDEASVERFISTTMPGWAQALRNTVKARAVALSQTSTTTSDLLPEAESAKMLGQ